MELQEAIRACQKACRTGREVLFARPTEWRNQGRAVDFGWIRDASIAKEVSPLSTEGTLQQKGWLPTPGELLGNWELVSSKALHQEGQRKG